MEEKYKNCPIVGCRVECGSVPCKSLRKTFGIDDEPQKRKTNADRIRAMSDEELAELFGAILHEREIIIIEKLHKQGIEARLVEAPGLAFNAHLEWLKQPVEV